MQEWKLRDLHPMKICLSMVDPPRRLPNLEHRGNRGRDPLSPQDVVLNCQAVKLKDNKSRVEDRILKQKVRPQKERLEM